MILDEESLVVNKKGDVNDIPVIIENDGISGITKYSSFRKSKDGGKKKRWSKEETAKFYTGLRWFGTDFTLMANVVFSGSRSREDLHNKFKREEKLHLNLIDDALKKSITAEIPQANIEDLTRWLKEGSDSEKEDEDEEPERDASTNKEDQESSTTKENATNPVPDKSSEDEEKDKSNSDLKTDNPTT